MTSTVRHCHTGSLPLGYRQRIRGLFTVYAVILGEGTDPLKKLLLLLSFIAYCSGRTKTETSDLWPLAQHYSQKRRRQTTTTTMTDTEDRKVALVTGITGQDGSYLAEFLLEKGYTVSGESFLFESVLSVVLCSP
jgi:hypothetical protein